MVCYSTNICLIDIIFELGRDFVWLRDETFV
jgi:hypothetical protein